jgi:hypothetical protein
VSDRLVTAAELADRLGLATGTVLDRFEAGRLPGLQPNGRGRDVAPGAAAGADVFPSADSRRKVPDHDKMPRRRRNAPGPA